MAREKCIGCGQCCGHYLPMTAKELAEITLYIDSHHIVPRWTGTSCPFLKKNRTCAIYDVRPAICRAYHCWPKFQGSMPGHLEDYHVYNTERAFILGDFTHFDGMIELASILAGNGGSPSGTFLSLFDGKEVAS